MVRSQTGCCLPLLPIRAFLLDALLRTEDGFPERSFLSHAAKQRETDIPRQVQRIVAGRYTFDDALVTRAAVSWSRRVRRSPSVGCLQVATHTCISAKKLRMNIVLGISETTTTTSTGGGGGCLIILGGGDVVATWRGCGSGLVVCSV